MKTKSADGVHVVVKDAFISQVPGTDVKLVSPQLSNSLTIRENLTLNPSIPKLDSLVWM